MTSPIHCGSCGNDCSVLENTIGPYTCDAGECVYTCADGYFDCDDQPGCETDGSLAESCGGCPADFACLDLIPNSETVRCENFACVADSCQGAYDSCGATDVELLCGTDLLSVNSCVDCDTSCDTVLNVDVITCTAAGCGYDNCLSGFYDCDGVASNGCEHDSTARTTCGACGADPAGSHGRNCNSADATRFNSVECVGDLGAQLCEYECSGDNIDCDGSAGTAVLGCEEVLSSVTTCGACINDCSVDLPNSLTQTCDFIDSVYQCVAVTCADGTAVCPVGTPNFDCATDTTSDPAYCATCDNSCVDDYDNTNSPACINSVCDFTVVDACADGFYDCDGLPENGCERPSTHCRPNTADLSGGLDANSKSVCQLNADDFDCASLIDDATANVADAYCIDAQSAAANPDHGLGEETYGGCFLVCDDGFSDCDRDVTNGCELNENDPNADTLCAQNPGQAICEVATLYDEFEVIANHDVIFAGTGPSAASAFDCSTVVSDPNINVSIEKSNPDPEASVCSAGFCVYDVLPGYYDCDKYPHNGAEIDLINGDGYNAPCVVATDVDCDFSADTRCGSNHCVDCTNLPGARAGSFSKCVEYDDVSVSTLNPLMVDGRCTTDSTDIDINGPCDPTRCLDLDQDWSNGCESAMFYETSSEFGRSINCAAIPLVGTNLDAAQGAPYCNGGADPINGATSGKCVIYCAAGFEDCDQDPRNGCEFNSADTSGPCGDQCTPFKIDIRCGSNVCMDCTPLPGSLLSEYSDPTLFIVRDNENLQRAQASASTCKLSEDSVYGCDTSRHFLNPSYDYPDAFNGACQTEFCNDSDGDYTNGCEAAQLYGRGPNYYFGDNRVRNIWDFPYVENKFQTAADNYNYKFVGRIGHTGIPDVFADILADPTADEERERVLPVEWESLLLLVKNLYGSKSVYNGHLSLPATTQPIILEGAAVDCKLSEWSTWGKCTYADSCKDSSFWLQTRIRTREIVTAAANGGNCYLPLVEDWYQFTSRDPRLGDGLGVESAIHNLAVQSFAGDLVLDFVTRGPSTYLADAYDAANTRPIMERTNLSTQYEEGTPIFEDERGSLVQMKYDGPVASTTYPNGGGDASEVSDASGVRRVGLARTCGSPCPFAQNQPQPVACDISAWSAWSDCTADCDGEWAGSVRIRTRQVLVQGAWSGDCFIDDFFYENGDPKTLEDIPSWAGQLFEEDWGCNHQSCSEFDCTTLGPFLADGVTESQIDTSAGAITPQCDGRDWPIVRDTSITSENNLINWDTNTFLRDAVEDFRYEFRWPGHCLYECKDGYLDCNGDPRDGCETPRTECLFNILPTIPTTAGHRLDTFSPIAAGSNNPYNRVNRDIDGLPENIGGLDTRPVYQTTIAALDYVNRDPTAHPWGKCTVAAQDSLRDPADPASLGVNCEDGLYTSLDNTVRTCSAGFCNRDCLPNFGRCSPDGPCVSIVEDDNCGAACVDCTAYPGDNISCDAGVCQRNCVAGCRDFQSGVLATSASDSNGCEVAMYQDPPTWIKHQPTEYSLFEGVSGEFGGWGLCTYSDDCGLAINFNNGFVNFVRNLGVEHQTRMVLKQAQNAGVDVGFDYEEVDGGFITAAITPKSSITESTYLNTRVCAVPPTQCIECTNWLLGIEVDCELSQWSDWGPCSAECNTENQYNVDGTDASVDDGYHPVTIRRRFVTKAASLGGRCPPTGDTWQAPEIYPFFDRSSHTETVRVRDQIAHSFVIEARVCNDFPCVYPLDCDALNDYYPGHFVGQHQEDHYDEGMGNNDHDNFVVCVNDGSASGGECDFACDLFNGYINLDGDLRDGCESYVYDHSCGGYQDGATMDAVIRDCTTLPGVSSPFAAPCVPTYGNLVSANETIGSSNFARAVNARETDDVDSFHLLRRYEYHPASIGDFFNYECDLRWACDSDLCRDMDGKWENGCETATNYVWPFAQDHRFYMGARRTVFFFGDGTDDEDQNAATSKPSLLVNPRPEHCNIVYNDCDQTNFGDEVFGFNIVDDRLVESGTVQYYTDFTTDKRDVRYNPDSKYRFSYDCSSIEDQCDFFDNDCHFSNFDGDKAFCVGNIRTSDKLVLQGNVVHLYPGAPFSNMEAIYGEYFEAGLVSGFANEGTGEGGYCESRCAANWADCDLDPNNGCETEISNKFDRIYPWQGDCSSACDIVSTGSCGADNCVDCTVLPGLVKGTLYSDPICSLQLYDVDVTGNDAREQYFGDDEFRPRRGADGAILYECDFNPEGQSLNGLCRNFFCHDFDGDWLTGCEVAVNYIFLNDFNEKVSISYQWKVDWAGIAAASGLYNTNDGSLEQHMPAHRANAADMYLGSNPVLAELPFRSPAHLANWYSAGVLRGGYGREIDCGSVGSCLDLDVEAHLANAGDSILTGATVTIDSIAYPICTALLEGVEKTVSCIEPLLCYSTYTDNDQANLINCDSEWLEDVVRTCYIDDERVDCPAPRAHIFQKFQLLAAASVADLANAYYIPSPAYLELPIVYPESSSISNCQYYPEASYLTYAGCDVADTLAADGLCSFDSEGAGAEIEATPLSPARSSINTQDGFVWPYVDYSFAADFNGHADVTRKPAFVEIEHPLLGTGLVEDTLFTTDDFNHWAAEFGCDPVPSFDCTFMFDLRGKWAKTAAGEFIFIDNVSDWEEPRDGGNLLAFHEVYHIEVDERVEGELSWGCSLGYDDDQTASQDTYFDDLETLAVAGLCVYECSAGYDDCDDDPSNGCETALVGTPCADYYYSCALYYPSGLEADPNCGASTSLDLYTCQPNWEDVFAIADGADAALVTKGERILPENNLVSQGVHILNACAGIRTSDQSCGEQCLNCHDYPGGFSFPVERKTLANYCNLEFGRCEVEPNEFGTPQCDPHLCYDGNDSQMDGCEVALGYPTQWFGPSRLSSLNARGYTLSLLDQKVLDTYFAGKRCYDLANPTEGAIRDVSVSCLNVAYGIAKGDNNADFQCNVTPLQPSDVDSALGAEVDCFATVTHEGAATLYVNDYATTVDTTICETDGITFKCPGIAAQGLGTSQGLRLGRRPGKDTGFSGFSFEGNYLELVGGHGSYGRYVTTSDAATGLPLTCVGMALRGARGDDSTAFTTPTTADSWPVTDPVSCYAPIMCAHTVVDFAPATADITMLPSCYQTNVRNQYPAALADLGAGNSNNVYPNYCFLPVTGGAALPDAMTWTIPAPLTDPTDAASFVRVRCPQYGQDAGLNPEMYEDNLSTGRYQSTQGFTFEYGSNAPASPAHDCVAIIPDQTRYLGHIYTDGGLAGPSASANSVDCLSPLRCWQLTGPDPNAVPTPDHTAYQTNFVDSGDYTEVPFCNGSLPDDYCEIDFVQVACPARPDGNIALDQYIYYTDANRQFSVRFDCSLIRAPAGITTQITAGPWFHVDQSKYIECDGGHNAFALLRGNNNGDQTRYECYYATASLDPVPTFDNGVAYPVDKFQRPITCEGTVVDCYTYAENALFNNANFDVSLDEPVSRSNNALASWTPRPVIAEESYPLYKQPTSPTLSIGSAVVLQAGTCAFVCEENWFNCDGDPTNGCEAFQRPDQSAESMLQNGCVNNQGCKLWTRSDSCGAGICTDCATLSGLLKIADGDHVQFAPISAGFQARTGVASSCGSTDLFVYNTEDFAVETFSSKYYGGQRMPSPQGVSTVWPGFWQCIIEHGDGASSCARGELSYLVADGALDIPAVPEFIFSTVQQRVYSCPNCYGYIDGTIFPHSYVGTSPFSQDDASATAQDWEGYLNTFEYDPVTHEVLALANTLNAANAPYDYNADHGNTANLRADLILPDNHAARRTDAGLGDFVGTHTQSLPLCQNYDRDWVNGCERALAYNIGATCYNIYNFDNDAAGLKEFTHCHFSDRVGVAPAYDSHFRRTLFPGFDCDILNYLPVSYTHINLGTGPVGCNGANGKCNFGDGSTLGVTTPGSGKCLTGWLDCDGNPWNGCETSRALCDTCGTSNVYTNSTIFPVPIAATCPVANSLHVSELGSFCDGGALPPATWRYWQCFFGCEETLDQRTDLWDTMFQTTVNVILPSTSIEYYADNDNNGYEAQVPTSGGAYLGAPSGDALSERYYYGLYEEIYVQLKPFGSCNIASNSDDCKRFSAYQIPGYWDGNMVDRSCYVVDRSVNKFLMENVATGYCRHICDRNTNVGEAIPECLALAPNPEDPVNPYIHGCASYGSSLRCGYQLCLNCDTLPGHRLNENTADCNIDDPLFPFCELKCNALCLDSDTDWVNGCEYPAGYDQNERDEWLWPTFDCSWINDPQPNAGSNDFGGVSWAARYHVVESLHPDAAAAQVKTNGMCIPDEAYYAGARIGLCDLYCKDGWHDVDGDPSNGCEVDGSLCRADGITARGYNKADALQPDDVNCELFANTAKNFIGVDLDTIYCDGLEGGDGLCHGYACNAPAGYCDSGSAETLLSTGCTQLLGADDVCGIDWAWRDYKEVRALYGSESVTVRDVPELFWSARAGKAINEGDPLHYRNDDYHDDNGVLPDYSFASLSNRCGSCRSLSGYQSQTTKCQFDERYANNALDSTEYATPNDRQIRRKPWHKAVKGDDVITMNTLGNTLSPYYCELHGPAYDSAAIVVPTDGGCDTNLCVDEDYYWHNGCETAVAYTLVERVGGVFDYHFSHPAQHNSQATTDINSGELDTTATVSKIWSDGQANRGIWCPFLQFWSLATDSYEDGDCYYYPCPHLDAASAGSWITCVSAEHAAADSTLTAGKCNYQCNTLTGWRDCDGAPMNGCEVDTWNDNTCSCLKVECNALDGLNPCVWTECKHDENGEGFCDLTNSCGVQYNVVTTDGVAVWEEQPLCLDANADGAGWMDGCETAQNYFNADGSVNPKNCLELNTPEQRALLHFQHVYPCNGEPGHLYSGKCEFICEAGWYDCDGDIDNGCEHDGTLCQVDRHYDLLSQDYSVNCDIALGYDTHFVNTEDRDNTVAARHADRARGLHTIYNWWGNDAYAYGSRAAYDCKKLFDSFPGHFVLDDVAVPAHCDADLASPTAGLCVGFTCDEANEYFDCDSDPRNGCEDAGTQENCGSDGQCRNCYQLSGMDYNSPNPVFILPERFMASLTWHLSTGTWADYHVTPTNPTFLNGPAGTHPFPFNYAVDPSDNSAVGSGEFTLIPVRDAANPVLALPILLDYASIGSDDAYFGDGTGDDRAVAPHPIADMADVLTYRAFFSACLPGDSPVDAVAGDYASAIEACRFDHRYNDLYWDFLLDAPSIQAPTTDLYRFEWSWQFGGAAVSESSANRYRQSISYQDDEYNFDPTAPVVNHRFEGYVLEPAVAQYMEAHSQFTNTAFLPNNDGDVTYYGANVAEANIAGYSDSVYDYTPKVNGITSATNIGTAPHELLECYFDVGAASFICRDDSADNHVLATVSGSQVRPCQKTRDEWEFGYNEAQNYWFNGNQEGGKWDCSLAGPDVQFAAGAWIADVPQDNTVCAPCVGCAAGPPDFENCPQYNVVQDAHSVGCDLIGFGGPLRALPGYYSNTDITDNAERVSVHENVQGEQIINPQVPNNSPLWPTQEGRLPGFGFDVTIEFAAIDRDTVNAIGNSYYRPGPIQRPIAEHTSHGRCYYECEAGFADYDADPRNGCEVNLSYCIDLNDQTGQLNIVGEDFNGPVVGISDRAETALGYRGFFTENDIEFDFVDCSALCDNDSTNVRCVKEDFDVAAPYCLGGIESVGVDDPTNGKCYFECAVTDNGIPYQDCNLNPKDGCERLTGSDEDCNCFDCGAIGGLIVEGSSSCVCGDAGDLPDECFATYADLENLRCDIEDLCDPEYCVDVDGIWQTGCEVAQKHNVRNLADDTFSFVAYDCTLLADPVFATLNHIDLDLSKFTCRGSGSQAGTCDFVCVEGWNDCDGNPANGCEKPEDYCLSVDFPTPTTLEAVAAAGGVDRNDLCSGAVRYFCDRSDVTAPEHNLDGVNHFGQPCTSWFLNTPQSQYNEVDSGPAAYDCYELFGNSIAAPGSFQIKSDVVIPYCVDDESDPNYLTKRGDCYFECNDGFADCNDIAQDGCEADITQDQTCTDACINCYTLDGLQTLDNLGCIEDPLNAGEVRCALPQGVCDADCQDQDGDWRNGCEAAMRDNDLDSVFARDLLPVDCSIVEAESYKNPQMFLRHLHIDIYEPTPVSINVSGSETIDFLTAGRIFCNGGFAPDGTTGFGQCSFVCQEGWTNDDGLTYNGCETPADPNVINQLPDWVRLVNA
eukprot:TRINITY_DN12178_c4_g1_i1.p1 TRINITY_DN12178_c4_g1~~TRINITY_DN12178_c4_g1_i1.p1  ORF type:complete len:6628 (+),score=1299.15 TRINITY_DN12178_c4_g1_i1:1306-19884(+)